MHVHGTLRPTLAYTYVGLPARSITCVLQTTQKGLMRRRTRIEPAVLVLALLLAGCETVGLSDADDAIRYKYETTLSQYTVEDTVGATFTNRSPLPIYVFQGCPTVGLEKRSESSWESVDIPIVCTAVVKPPIPVKPGESKQFGIASKWLMKADVEPGTYRLTLAIGRTVEKATEQATSTRFEITD